MRIASNFLIAILLGALLGSQQVCAQGSPGLIPGQVMTDGFGRLTNSSASQWNGYFATKQNYPVPLGSASIAGRVKVDGTTIAIAADGTISVVSSTGIIPLSRGGLNFNLTLTGGTSQFLRQNTPGGQPAFVRPSCADLSDSVASCFVDATNASNLSSGLVPLARGGLNLDLTGTGGASLFLRQNTLGGQPSFVRPSAADLSNGTTGSNAVVLATGAALAAPALTGGTMSALTAFALRDTSAAFDVTLAATSSSALSAARTLTLDVVNGSRTLKLASNLTVVTDPGGVTGAVKSNGSGTFTQAALPDLSGITSSSTWTLTDGSGAGLSLSPTDTNYAIHDKLCHASFAVTYPSTASGSIAQFSGLPCTSKSGTAGTGACVLLFQNANLSGLMVGVVVGTSTIKFFTPAGGTVPNSSLSTFKLQGNCTFITA